MKKEKKIAIVKEAKKLAKKELEEQVVDSLKFITAKFEKHHKKIDKLINKTAKQLIKKLSKETLLKPVEAKTEPVIVLEETKKPITKIKNKKEEQTV